MPIRVTDSALSLLFQQRINTNRQKVEAAQERIVTGKRINRPSDDPFGTGTVLRLRTSQATVEQFQSIADTVKEGLQVADTALDSYERLLDRAKVLLAQGASDSTSSSAKQAIALELDALRQQMLNVANHSSQGTYTFGGTRQSVAPFDSAGVATATPASNHLVQIEPGVAPVTAGITAEGVFSDTTGTVFATMSAAATALRGTGDSVADRAAVLGSIDRIIVFVDRAGAGRSQLGASMNAADNARARLENESLLYQESIANHEAADLAGAAIELTQATNGLQATLQSIAVRNKGSLMDLIG